MKQRLELTWIGKDETINPEPRILMYDKSRSYGDQNTENLLIHGDNLLALKALELEYAGKIKCIYIDPPYNTGSAFEQYDDNLEHSTWLSLMKPRLELLRNLLSDDGSIWISIDDDEGHYLKVLCDEAFGRNNFINTMTWEKKYTIANDAKWFSDNHDFILVYAKDKINWKPNRLPRTEEMNKAYKNPDNHPKGVWKSTPLHAKSGSANSDGFSYTFRNGVTWSPPAGTFPRFSIETLDRLDSNDEIWFGKDGMAIPSRKTFLCDLKSEGIPSNTVWRFDDAGHNHEAREEVKVFNPKSVFATPKPERLIQRILTLATAENDLVLDSFLGSGTTAAVAMKTNRRFIGIELGEHCYTHCIPRLKAVIDGEQGGISKSENWQGGGGYKFLELAESLLEKDQFGQLVISDKYNAQMLAAAMAKLKGYFYNPDRTFFWKQGRQGANNYIFTTTYFVTPEYLDMVHIEMAEGEHLLICCEAFDEACRKRYKNIIVQKIPQILLGRCEFGRNNYDLNVITKDIDLLEE